MKCNLFYSSPIKLFFDYINSFILMGNSVEVRHTSSQYDEIDIIIDKQPEYIVDKQPESIIDKDTIIDKESIIPTNIGKTLKHRNVDSEWTIIDGKEK